MPPTVEEIPLPTDRKGEAVRWLESKGFRPRTPSIHSSDYELVLSDPFLYYLTRRLGLARALSWSKALNRGSWLHSRAHLLWKEDATTGTLPLEDAQRLRSLFNSRLEELKEISRSQGITGDPARSILDREQRDFLCAMGWFDAAKLVTVPHGYGNIPAALRAAHFKHLGSELEITYLDPSWPGTPLVVTIDDLLYHQSQDTLWIVDWKSCDESPKIRLASCPLEHQTWLYSYVLSEDLRDPASSLRTRFSLPASTKFGGFIHVAVQKPTIDICSKDCNYTLTDFTPSRGKNKGITRQEKEHYGEPRLENYIARCREWYLGEGEYANLAAERADDPPVNFSFTHALLLSDPDFLDRFRARMNLIHQYATCRPWPSNFPENPSSIRPYGTLSNFAPFYLSSIAHWPEVVQRNGFIISHRDDRTLESPQ